MTKLTKPNGSCAVCVHVERSRIELLIAGGASQLSVAGKFGLSKFSVHRHWNRHVPEERKATLLLGPVQRQALAARVSEESEAVLDHYKAVRAGLYQVYDNTVTAGDAHGAAHVAAQLLKCLDSMARLTGELASSPLVQINQQNVFINDPNFMRFQGDLIRVLSLFPEARAAVLAEFERIEAEAQPAIPVLEVKHDQP